MPNTWFVLRMDDEEQITQVFEYETYERALESFQEEIENEAGAMLVPAYIYRLWQQRHSMIASLKSAQMFLVEGQQAATEMAEALLLREVNGHLGGVLDFIEGDADA